MNGHTDNSHNVAAQLSQQAHDNPQQMAIACPQKNGGYQQLNYQELDQLSDTIARGLRIHGISAGMRCVLMVPPSIEFFALTFALFKIGAVMVCIDPGIGLRNLRICIAESDPQVFIGVQKAHLARKILRWSAPALHTFIAVGPKSHNYFGMSTYAALLSDGENAQDPAWHNGQASDPAAILFTSGSTGIPKGVVYRHSNFSHQVEALRELYGITAGEIDLCTFPLFALFSPALGMSAVIPDMDFTKPGSVHPPHIIDPVNAFKVTQMFGSPALLKRVAAYGIEHQSQMPSLQRVLSAGAPVHPQVIEDFTRMLNDDCQIFTPYGATESLPVASVGSHDILHKYRSANEDGQGICVGAAAPNMCIKIIPISDDPIREWNPQLALPAGDISQLGEIIVRGPVVTESYFNRPQSTNLAKIPISGTQDFYHRMGDLGYIDRDGLLWFCGRKSHRVETAKTRYLSIPCEAIFNQHPDVERSALIRIERNGEILAGICVELRAGIKNIRYADLSDYGHAHKHTADIKHFYIHPSFPVDIRHNAKINRDLLSQWAHKKSCLL